jgi:hypothetical protein
MGTRSAHVASLLLRVSCEHLFAAAAPDPLFGSTLFVWLFIYLFVCLFVCVFACLLACLLACDWPLQNTPSMARPRPHARRRVVMAYPRFAAQDCAVRALVRRHQPSPSRCRTSALH